MGTVYKSLRDLAQTSTELLMLKQKVLLTSPASPKCDDWRRCLDIQGPFLQFWLEMDQMGASEKDEGMNKKKQCLYSGSETGKQSH